MEFQEDIEHISEEIQRYLLNHPNAADTLEGIMGWWLPKQRYQETLEQVQQALNYLVARGRIERKVNPYGSGTYIYKKPNNFEA